MLRIMDGSKHMQICRHLLSCLMFICWMLNGNHFMNKICETLCSRIVRGWDFNETSLKQIWKYHEILGQNDVVNFLNIDLNKTKWEVVNKSLYYFTLTLYSLTEKHNLFNMRGFLILKISLSYISSLRDLSHNNISQIELYTPPQGFVSM